MIKDGIKLKKRKSFLAYAKKPPIIGDFMSCYILKSEENSPLSSYVVMSERVTQVMDFSPEVHYIKVIYTESCDFFLMILQHEAELLKENATFVQVDDFDKLQPGKFFVFRRIIFEDFYPRTFLCEVRKAVSVKDRDGVKIIRDELGDSLICIP